MVMRVPLLVAILCTLVTGLALADTDIPTLMRQGQRAFIAGDDETASEAFNEVLQADPQNTMAIAFLRKIKMREAGAAPTPQKSAIEELIIPKIEFKDASFAEALEFLRQKAAASSVSVSFVSQLPPAQMRQQITLSLSSIPFMEALRYLCTLDNATYKVEKYAIVILPVVPGADASPAAQ